MNTLKILKQQNIFAPTSQILGWVVLSIACVLAMPYLFNDTAITGFVDAGIWQLLLIALITWVVTLWLCIKAFYWILQYLGLPEITILVSHFNNLTTWQKLKSYFLLFVSLLGSIGLTIIAVV